MVREANGAVCYPSTRVLLLAFRPFIPVFELILILKDHPGGLIISFMLPYVASTPVFQCAGVAYEYLSLHGLCGMALI